jgi:predicted deacylase
LLWGVAVLGTDPKAGSRVLVEEAGVVAVGTEVSGTTDTDPQAITASIIARQDVIRTL